MGGHGSVGKQVGALCLATGILFFIVGAILKSKETSETAKAATAKKFNVIGGLFVVMGLAGFAYGYSSVGSSGAYYYF